MHHVPVKDDILLFLIFFKIKFKCTRLDLNGSLICCGSLLFRSSHGVSRKTAKPGYERGAERFQGQQSS